MVLLQSMGRGRDATRVEYGRSISRAGCRPGFMPYRKIETITKRCLVPLVVLWLWLGCSQGMDWKPVGELC
jgi:hypothetical protein